MPDPITPEERARWRELATGLFAPTKNLLVLRTAVPRLLDQVEALEKAVTEFSWLAKQAIKANQPDG